MTQPDMTQPDMTQPDLTQPGLFDPDDATLDLPVPYTLTVRGRRVVDDLPPLRVVDDPPGRTGGGDPDRVASNRDRTGDPAFVADLDHTDTWRQARVRAMARAGHEPAKIAAEADVPAGVDPAGTTLGSGARRTDRPRPGSSATGGSRRSVAESARAVADARGRAIVATCGAVEVGAVTATTSRIAVAVELVAWLRTFHGVPDGGIRVVLRVADRSTADLVARAWADRLDLTPDRVSTVHWSRAPSPRAVQAMVRVTGRELAAHLRETLLDWPAVPGPNAVGG